GQGGQQGTRRRRGPLEEGRGATGRPGRLPGDHGGNRSSSRRARSARGRGAGAARRPRARCRPGRRLADRAMPELPEVETVRAGIEHHVVGRTVAPAEVFIPRAVRRDLAGPDGFAAAMAGRTFLRAERRGKYLWFALDDCISRGGAPPSPPTEALLAHLGMSGQFLVGDADRP